MRERADRDEAAPAGPPCGRGFVIRSGAAAVRPKPSGRRLFTATFSTGMYRTGTCTVPVPVKYYRYSVTSFEEREKESE